MKPTKKTPDKDNSKGKVTTQSSKSEIVCAYLPKVFKLLDCQSEEDAMVLLASFPDSEREGGRVVKSSTHDQFQKQMIEAKEASLHHSIMQMDQLLKDNANMKEQNKALSARLDAFDSPVAKKPKLSQPPLDVASVDSKPSDHAGSSGAVVVTPVKSTFANLPTWKKDPRSCLAARGSNQRTGKSALQNAMAKKNTSKGMTLNLYWLYKPPQQALGTVVLFDFVDSLKGHLHWCHKPDIWGAMFNEDSLLAPKDQQFTGFHHQIRACRQRAQRGGANLGKSIEINKQKGQPYFLEFMSLYRQVSKDLTSSEVKDMFITNLMCLATNHTVQETYHATIGLNSRSTALL